jgi:hypothetical protein
MTNQLFQNVNELSETTKKKIETRLSQYGNHLKIITSSQSTTLIIYRSDNLMEGDHERRHKNTETSREEQERA